MNGQRRFNVIVAVAFLALALGWPPAGAESVEGSGKHLLLVVNPESGVTRLSREDIINIFMGRYRILPTGIPALPIDQAAEREQFYRLLVNKTLAEINAYWARLVFSGRASPPILAPTATDVKTLVANNMGAIGYLLRSDLDSSVHPVYNLSTMSAELPR